MGALLQDIGYGLRLCRRNPGFTAVAILALGIGIGANTAIFSVVDGVLLRPLPYPEPDRLMMVYEKEPDFSRTSVSYENFLDWRRDNRLFADLASFRGEDMNFTGSGQPEHLSGEYVSYSLFSVLGVRPLLGRTFLPQEDQQGAGGVTILNYAFWKRRFGGDPSVIGRTLTLNARPYAVIGVMPQGFHFREMADLYIPIEQWNSIALRDRENHPGLRVVGRLRPGVTMASAQADMDAIGRRLAEAYPKSNTGRGVIVAPTKDDMVGYIKPTLLMLLGAVGLVLVIACSNVANLLLARATARRHEFAIRAALGAGRWRAIRQLLTESVILSLGGAGVGLAIAAWGTRAVVAAAPMYLPPAEEVGLNGYVLGFTLGVSILTGILFGLAPAFHSSNVTPEESLRAGARGSGGGRHRAEPVFIAVEVGLAVVLLSGAGLMIQSIWRLWKVDPGFNTSHLLTSQVAISPRTMSSAQAIRLANQQIVSRIEAAPGIQAAAVTSLIPLGENDSEIGFWIGGGPHPPSDQVTPAVFSVVTPDYTKAMGIPLRSGRFFTNRDTLSSTPVVVIDDVMAQHVFPHQDPLGKQISLIAFGPVQVVGVVGHVKQWGLDSDDTAKIRSELYFPLMQVPDKFMSAGVAGLNLVVRTTPDPLSMLSVVRAQVAGPTEDQPMYSVQTMEQLISMSLEERRFTMLLLIIFSATALVLASVGIYAVMSYAVSRRTHEIGVRLALGATRREVLAMVLREGVALAAVGTVLGLASAVAVTRLLASLLYGVKPADPWTLATVAVAVGAVAVLASYPPALRATRVNLVTALRYE